MTNRTYDTFAFIQRVVVPAFVTMLIGFGDLLGFGDVAQVIGSAISLVDTFLGVFLYRESNRYFDSVQETAYLVEEDDEEDEQEGGVG